jgi:hypothetical protein
MSATPSNFDPGTYTFPKGTTIGVTDGTEFDLSGKTFTPGKKGGGFLDILSERRRSRCRPINPIRRFILKKRS